MNKINLLVENCWVIRGYYRNEPRYHVVGNQWSSSPLGATIYRSESNARQFIDFNRGYHKPFVIDEIIEPVPLEGAILVAGIQSAAQKG